MLPLPYIGISGNTAPLDLGATFTLPHGSVVAGDHIVMIGGAIGYHNFAFPTDFSAVSHYNAFIYGFSEIGGSTSGIVFEVVNPSTLSFTVGGSNSSWLTPFVYLIIRDASTYTFANANHGDSPVDFPSLAYGSPDGGAMIVRTGLWTGDPSPNDLLGSFGTEAKVITMLGLSSYNTTSQGLGIWYDESNTISPAPNVSATQSTHDSSGGSIVTCTLAFWNSQVPQNVHSQDNNPSPVGNNRIPISAEAGTPLPPRLLPSDDLDPSNTLIMR